MKPYKKILIVGFFGTFVCFSSSLLAKKTQCEHPFQQKLEIENLSFKEKTQKREPSKKQTHLSKKERGKKLVQAFNDKNFQEIEDLVKIYPDLKNIRITDTSFLNEKIELKDQDWSPRGWGLLQLASYSKDIEMLDKLLQLDFPIRTNKVKNRSIESNSLHIALRKNFQEGVSRILKQSGYVPYGKRGRFIDEKDHNTITPWIRAIIMDQRNEDDNHSFTELIGSFKPSAHVESRNLNGDLVDAWQMALKTQDPMIKDIAKRALGGLKTTYGEYKEMRIRHPEKRTYPADKHSSKKETDGWVSPYSPSKNKRLPPLPNY